MFFMSVGELRAKERCSEPKLLASVTWSGLCIGPGDCKPLKFSVQRPECSQSASNSSCWQEKQSIMFYWNIYKARHKENLSSEAQIQYKVWLPEATLSSSPFPSQMGCLKMTFAGNALLLTQGVPSFCLTLVLPTHLSKAFACCWLWKGNSLCLSLSFEQVLQHHKL